MRDWLWKTHNTKIKGAKRPLYRTVKGEDDE